MHTISPLARMVLGGICAVAWIGSAAAEPQSLGSFKDWSAYKETGAGNSVCYMGSTPVKAEGDYTQRGEIYLLVSHRPAENIVGEVSIETGYRFKSGSEVTATIDGKAFKMFTRGENAWAYDAKADRAMVTAMKRGQRMVVKGTSWRGTLTTDTYSLSGFTAAFNAISKACNVR